MTNVGPPDRGVILYYQDGGHHALPTRGVGAACVPCAPITPRRVHRKLRPPVAMSPPECFQACEGA